MAKLRLNTLLGKTDYLGTAFRALIADYRGFFADKSSNFRGEKKTYTANQGTVDDPSKRGNKLVVTTVDEKLEWFEETNKEYVDAIFAQEATNASGIRAELMVEGKSWGELTSLELLRLKSFIENNELEQMYQAIPTRASDQEWFPVTDEQYKNRAIHESAKDSGISKSVMKEDYIMNDPNIEKVKSGSYTPSLGKKDTIIELGQYTYQKFSGEWTARQKAELGHRRKLLLSAVIEALKVANEAEVVESKLTAGKLFSYLHRGVNG